MKITSVTNERVKRVMRLRAHASARREEGLTLVEGARETGRALAAGVVCEELYLCPDLLVRVDRRERTVFPGAVRTLEVTAAVFERMAYGERKEGVLAVCRPPLWTLADVTVKAPALCVVVEAVEKPGNLGAILRTCDAVGVDAVMVDPGTDIYSPNCVRASVGTVFTVPVVPASREETLDFLRRRGIVSVAAAPAAKRSFFEVDFKRPTAVVVGREDQGLSEAWLTAADTTVSIPMRGAADSLNVAVSTAVLLYEARRQRLAGKGGR